MEVYETFASTYFLNGFLLVLLLRRWMLVNISRGSCKNPLVGELAGFVMVLGDIEIDAEYLFYSSSFHRCILSIYLYQHLYVAEFIQNTSLEFPL